MDEKTEELRDIFLGVAEDGTVTERQAEQKGSLAADEGAADEQLREVLAEMHESYDFGTDLDDDSLVRVVRGFHEGETDADLAETLEEDEETIVRARLDCHLVREDDLDGHERARLRRLLADESESAVADELGVSVERIGHYQRVLSAEAAARQVSERFRAAFADALPDAAIATSMTEEMREDGLADATDGSETNTTL